MGAFIKERIYIEGLMPERALLRLRRAGIPLFRVQKTNATTLLVSVRKKDLEKVFAIYPNVCYNNSRSSSFTAKLAPKKGAAKWLHVLKNRVGLWLGALLFIGGTAFADGLVCGVEFVGTDVYARETYAALREANIRLFAPYRKGKEDLICAKLLSIDGVEFCSVKKRGMRLVVEIRTAPFGKESAKDGQLYADRDGVILSMTVLRGTALKKIGDRVNAGEPLVGDWFSTEDGGQVRVQAIARVRIACTYEKEIAAATEQEAFAIAYLAVGADSVVLRERSVTATERGFAVRLAYESVQTINF